MATPIIQYDEASDTLYITFEPGVVATGIELNEHLLLRIDRQRGQAVGLTVFEYSVLAQPTDLGPRSVPLTGLADLSEEFRALVVDLLSRPPVNELLLLSAYMPSAVETIPITTLHPLPAVTSELSS
jgi:uncharacterized protein YuzE